MKIKRYNVLLIEDDEVDIIATNKAFAQVDIVPIIAKDGIQALEILNEKKHPLIILLDINLPRVNGFELLKILKSSENLKHIPVIIMTSSTNDEDVLHAYKNYAAGYITKPLDALELKEKIEALDKYWTICEI